jgi:hypothetical protein
LGSEIKLYQDSFSQAGSLDSFLQLLNSFTPRLANVSSETLQENSMQAQISNAMEMSFGVNGKAVGLLSSLQAVEQEEPGQTNYDDEFDETGYLSSDSSLYDVGSDDKNYNDYT